MIWFCYETSLFGTRTSNKIIMNTTTTTPEEAKRQQNIQYIKLELRKLSSIRTQPTLSENIVKEERIIFTDIANWLNELYDWLEHSISILELWNLEQPYIEWQSDKCISLILDMLP